MELEKIIRLYDESKIEDYGLGTELPLDVVDFDVHQKELQSFADYLPQIFEKRYDECIARYVTALVQRRKSKKVSLNLKIPLSIGYNLNDKRLIIRGNVGDNAFMYSHNCSVEIQGDVGDKIGYIAEGCSFKIVNGKIGKDPLCSARNCKLELIRN